MALLSSGAATTGVGVAPPPNLNRQTTPTAPATPSLSSLTPTAPAASTFAASTGTAAPVGAAPTAAAKTTGPIAGINNGMINPNDATNAASQLDTITSSSSPYMQLARQQGMLSAANRGLGNSSIAAGASEAAATAAAAPLAEQNAGAATNAALQNSQLETQASEFNAGQENANKQLEAQLATQTSQFNAGQTQGAAATNAAAINSVNQQITSIKGALSGQLLSNIGSQQLAEIQGMVTQNVATTQSTAAIVQTALSGINSILNNKDLDATRTSVAINSAINTLNSALKAVNVVFGGPAPAAVSGNAPAVPGPTPPTRPRP